jgi:hypothetical protein
MKAFLLVFLVLTFISEVSFAANFSEGFENGIDNWVVVDEPDVLLNAKGPSNWVIQSGPFKGKALNQTTNIWGDPPDIVALGSFIIYDKQEFKNFDLSVDMQANDNDGVGIVFGWKDRKDHYRIFTMIDPGNPGGAAGNAGDPGKAPWTLIERRTGDDSPYYKTLKVVKEAAYQQGTPVTFRLVVKDGAIEFYADKKKLAEANDPIYKSGKIGFTVYAQSGCFFDNLNIIDNSATVEHKSKLASTWGSLKSLK